MTLPDPNELPSIEALSHYEAIDLFVQRAAAVRPGFTLTDANAHAIAEICTRLDGLPLAIELATARLRLMTPQEMTDRLDQRLSLLKGGGRDLPERQQTLRSAIAWSYELLDEDHRRFFRALGAFAGGFTLDAGEKVADPDGALGFEAVEVMVDNSLVRRAETGRGTTRFRMLQTIREYAQETLRSAGEDADLRSRHAEYFHAFVASRAPRVTMDADALDEIEEELDNIRAALRWSIDSGSTSLGQQMAATLWRFWQMRGHLAEARRWLTEILAMPGADEATLDRARAVMALGSITYWQNDFDETRRCYEEALKAFRTVGEEEGLQEALYNSGFLWLLERDPGPAKSVFEESRCLAEKRGDTLGRANCSWGLAVAAIQERDFDEASRWGDECGRLFEQERDVYGKGLARFVHYQIARFTGRYDEARELMRAYIEDSMRDTAEAMSSLELLAEVELQAGNVARGLKLAAAGRAFREAYGGGSPEALIELSDAREIALRSLDAETVEEIWAEGFVMPRSEALAFALKSD
jgi:tetratricopeptide (TPR) repeat protein